MSGSESRTDALIAQLRDLLTELTEVADLENSPFRFLAVIAREETDPENGDMPSLSNEIFSVGGTEDIGDMLSSLVQVCLEEEEDNPNARFYIAQSVMEPLRSVFNDEEEDEDGEEE